MDEEELSLSRRTVVAIWNWDQWPDCVLYHESGYSCVMTLSTCRQAQPNPKV
jgi:hypothetical protein